VDFKNPKQGDEGARSYKLKRGGSLTVRTAGALQGPSPGLAGHNWALRYFPRGTTQHLVPTKDWTSEPFAHWSAYSVLFGRAGLPSGAQMPGSKAVWGKPGGGTPPGGPSRGKWPRPPRALLRFESARAMFTLLLMARRDYCGPGQVAVLARFSGGTGGPKFKGGGKGGRRGTTCEGTEGVGIKRKERGVKKREGEKRKEGRRGGERLRGAKKPVQKGRGNNQTVSWPGGGALRQNRYPGGKNSWGSGEFFRGTERTAGFSGESGLCSTTGGAGPIWGGMWIFSTVFLSLPTALKGARAF